VRAGGNILLKEQGLVKLADFGACKRLGEVVDADQASAPKGTVLWMAPEVIQGRQYSEVCRPRTHAVTCPILRILPGTASKAPHCRMRSRWGVVVSRWRSPISPALHARRGGGTE